MFEDRADAGRRLAEELKIRRVAADLALGIPRGGLLVAWEVARSLGCPLDAVVARKLPFPDDPEAGFGAVAEDGSLCLLPGAADRLTRETVRRVIREQAAEARRRVAALRGSRPLPDLRGRSVVVVDDGIAMGSTMLAALRCCRRLGARRLVAAAPVAAPEARELLHGRADEVALLACPAGFFAVAQYYSEWRDIGDDEAAAVLRRPLPPLTPA